MSKNKGAEKKPKTTKKKILDGLGLGFFMGLFFIVPLCINLVGSTAGGVVVGGMVAMLAGIAVEFYTN